MPRLVRALAGRTYHIVGNLMSRLTCALIQIFTVSHSDLVISAVSLNNHFVLVQHRKTRPNMTEKLLNGTLRIKIKTIDYISMINSFKKFEQFIASTCRQPAWYCRSSACLVLYKRSLVRSPTLPTLSKSPASGTF